MTTEKKKRKLLIVINYWSGDRDMAKHLAELIADLEPTANDNADIMFHRRNDAEQMPTFIKDKLGDKFKKVHEVKCKRMNAVGYPFGCNEMFYDLLERMGNREWQLDYYAFLNLEADCCPLHPDWIKKMIEAYDDAYNSGKSAVGHVVNSHIKTHLNGVAVYSTDFWHKAGGMNIIGGPATEGYDVYHADRILPLSIDTEYILLDFNRKTISPGDLGSLSKHGKTPYLLHGVKDHSALVAVRSKYVGSNISTSLPVALKTIFTYYDLAQEYNQEEQKRQIETWKTAWKAYGFNPVVLSEWDASKNPIYHKIKPALKNLKGKVSRKKELATIFRWLALEYSGGGFYVEYDVFPNHSFTSDDVHAPDGFWRLSKNSMAAVSADRNGLRYATEAIDQYDYSNLEYVPTDSDILDAVEDKFWIQYDPICAEWNDNRWSESKLVHFSLKACRTTSASPHKPSIIEQHLKTLRP